MTRWHDTGCTDRDCQGCFDPYDLSYQQPSVDRRWIVGVGVFIAALILTCLVGAIATACFP